MPMDPCRGAGMFSWSVVVFLYRKEVMRNSYKSALGHESVSGFSCPRRRFQAKVAGLSDNTLRR